jgi:hypothetical protein
MLPKAETVKPRKIAVQWVYEENDLGGSPRPPGTQPPRPVGRQAMHHVHAGAGILTEAMHYTGQNTSRARDLTDLEPEAWRSRVAL